VAFADVDEALRMFLRDLHHRGYMTVSSDAARLEAAYVAKAASMGLISTRAADGSWGRRWRLTSAGLMCLECGL
jgi:hypothetical protein